MSEIALCSLARLGSFPFHLVFLRITQYRNRGKVYIMHKFIPLYLFEFVQISGVFLVFATHVSKC